MNIKIIFITIKSNNDAGVKRKLVNSIFYAVRNRFPLFMKYCWGGYQHKQFGIACRTTYRYISHSELLQQFVIVQADPLSGGLDG